MTPDQKLAAFLAADARPPRDPGFEIAVARRVAARRAWLSGLALVPWMGVVGVLLWGLDAALRPHLDGLARSALPLAMPLTLAVAGVAATLWTSRRLGPG